MWTTILLLLAPVLAGARSRGGRQACNLHQQECLRAQEQMDEKHVGVVKGHLDGAATLRGSQVLPQLRS